MPPAATCLSHRPTPHPRPASGPHAEPTPRHSPERKRPTPVPPASRRIPAGLPGNGRATLCVHRAAGGVFVTTGPEEAAAAGRGHLRASHADREHVIDLLKAAFVAGRLTKDELDTRAGQAFTARTYAELAPITADIPAGPLAPRPTRRPSRLRDGSARTPGARNAAVASVGSMVSSFLLFAHGVHLDDVNTRVWLTGAFVFFLLGLIFAIGALVELKRSRGQLPPPSGGDTRPPARQRPASRAPDPSPPAPTPDQNRPNRNRPDQNPTNRNRPDRNRADAQPRTSQPDRPRERGAPSPRGGSPIPTTA
jgi:Domain of unknown function (DUF1707)